jgi:hypothetical protein
VQHSGFNEREGFAPQADIFTGGNDVIGPIFLVKMFQHRLVAHLGADDFFRLDELDHLREATGMIQLDMIDYNVVNFFRICEFANVVDQFVFKGSLYGVNQGRFLVNYQV